MVKVDLTEKEIKHLIEMMSGASVQIGMAEEAIKLLNKFKNAL